MVFVNYNGNGAIVQQNLNSLRPAGIVALRGEMKQFSAKVLANDGIAKDYYRMSFEWNNGAEAPAPGQFVSIRSFGTTDLILRRPFAVSAFDAGRSTAEIVYQKRGKATNMLAATGTGEHLDLIGPLGNQFPLESTAKAILVAGGVGLGPMLFFGSHLAASGHPATVVLGFRDAGYVPSFLDEEENTGFRPVICTDDGSRGFHGTTVQWLESTTSGRGEEAAPRVVYACGPNPMMAGCSRFCAEQRIVCWVSMEQIMGCGVGACVGCAIPVTDGSGYARVCTEGPVFDANQILWERLV